MAALVSGEFSGGGNNWSTMATIKMVSSAATEERTGEVREIKMRKEPENAENNVSLENKIPRLKEKGQEDILAFASTLITIIHACSPLGRANSSHPI